MKQHKYVRTYITLLVFQNLCRKMYVEVQERSRIRRLQLASIFVAIRAKLAYEKRIAKLGANSKIRMKNELRQALTVSSQAITN